MKFRNFPHGVHIHTQCTDGRSLKLSRFLKSACKYFFKKILDILNYAWQYSICWNIPIKFSTMLAWQYFLAMGFPIEKYSQLLIRCNLCKEAIFSYFSFLLLKIFTTPHRLQSSQKRHIFVTFPFLCCWKFSIFLIKCSLSQWPHWLYVYFW